MPAPTGTICPEHKGRRAPGGHFAAGGSFTLILRTASGDALLPAPTPHPHYIFPAPAPESDQSFLLEHWFLLLENHIQDQDLGTWSAHCCWAARGLDPLQSWLSKEMPVHTPICVPTYTCVAINMPVFSHWILYYIKHDFVWMPPILRHPPVNISSLFSLFICKFPLQGDKPGSHHRPSTYQIAQVQHHLPGASDG